MSNSTLTTYSGPWINWSHGLLSGSTITLSERSGGLLTAFIATFVTIVGAELWKILCYILHQIRSSRTPQDGLYHQQQVILKNSPTPGGAAWLWLMQTWTWAGKARLSFLRTLPWTIFGVCYIIVFGLAAVFSSQISKSPGPQRLLRSDRCGTWALDLDSPDYLVAQQSKFTNDTLNAATYAKACYGGADGPQCGRYIVPSIDWTGQANAPCPFESGMCQYNDNSAYSITTGMINSHFDLGINSRPEGRVELEKTTTCAPLRTRNFATLVNVTDENEATELGVTGDQIIKFWLGPMLGNATANTTDFTYQYNLHGVLDSIGYSLNSFMSLADYPAQGGVTVPIKQINNSMADLSLLFLASNSIRFNAPNNDPLFSANLMNNGTGVPFWTSDQWVTVLGCAESYRVCNPVNGVCSPRQGSWQLEQSFLNNKDGLNFNLRQNATAFRIVLSVAYSSVYHATNSRGGNALRASEMVSDLEQAALPNNQWEVEIGAWVDTGLARLQALIEGYVTNPSNIVPGSKLVPFTPAVRANTYYDMCFDQLVNDSSNSMSFSVVGLAILFILGGIIILLSLILDTLAGYIQQKLGHGLHARMEWLVNDKLQMQRMLHSQLKLGQWHDVVEKVPITVGYGDHKFMGPAEHELLAQRYDHGEVMGQDGSGVQLVEQEQEGKGGWHQQTTYLGHQP